MRFFPILVGMILLGVVSAQPVYADDSSKKVECDVQYSPDPANPSQQVLKVTNCKPFTQDSWQSVVKDIAPWIFVLALFGGFPAINIIRHSGGKKSTGSAASTPDTLDKAVKIGLLVLIGLGCLWLLVQIAS